MIEPEQILLIAEPSKIPVSSPQEMALARERRQEKSAAYEVNQIGKVAHLRKLEKEHSKAQKEAAETCTISFYPDGMGIRVERRKVGYSWAGSDRVRRELVGEGDERCIVKAGGGKRGKCKGATVGSMARMRDTVYKISRSHLPVMITLGWPKAQTPDPKETKRCLHAFLECLGRRFKRAAVLWKLEFGESSGLPHYHLLLWGAKPWHRWVAETWSRICATKNPEHLEAGTRIEKLRSYRGTLAYCGKKYVCKTGTPPPGDWGRVWGIWHKVCIPWAEAITVDAPWHVGMWYSRILRRYMRAQSGGKYRTGGRGRVLWRTTDFVEQWLRVLEWAERMPIPGRAALVECPF